MTEFIDARNERLIKVADVAKILNISRALAYRLLQNGDIPAIRINHAVRVRPSDLDEYIEKCRNVGSINISRF
jgi:excisionase family DNA binding protein